MKRKKQILTAVILSGSVGLGAQSILAQSAPGGQTGPGAPGQPGPSVPRQTQPTIPGQPAPGLPQTEPMPGQPGTIPERVERPSAGDKGMVVSSEDIKKAKEALKAKGLNPGPIDGTLDSKTQQALRDFQKANKLPVTGVLDAQTAEKLGVSTGKGSIPERAPGSSVPKDSPMPRK
jgi:peptidoglycan hydrolase-like protein with peptidoglycan-binding domain